MVSALIGQPPNGEEDYLIVKGIMRRIGLEGLDPAKGILIPPARPVNDQYRSRGPGILAGDSVCIFLIVLITGARLLIRAFYRGLQWGWDDWLILLASLVVLSWFSGSLALVVYGGQGKHIWDLTYHEFSMYARIGFVLQTIYLPGAILIKMSIVTFNRRITGLASKAWRRINDGFFAILTLYMIAYSIWLGVRCPNNNKTLIQLAKAKSYSKCDTHQALHASVGMSVIHTVLGFCLLFTPIIILWKIKMSRAKKYPLFGIFVIGSISCIAALMVTISQYQLHQDATWNSLQLQNWIVLDLLFGIIVASLPVLYGQVPKTWSLFRTYRRSHSLSQSGHRDPTNTHTEMKTGRKGGANGLYTNEDVECHGNVFRLDDQVELLEQPSRPAVALINRPHTRGEIDTEFGKQASCNVSLESAPTPPLPGKH